MAIVVNSILLAAFMSALIMQVYKELRLKGFFKDSLKHLNVKYDRLRINKEIKRYTSTVIVDMNLTEKIELYLIDKSNIKRYIPFMSFPFLCFCCLLIFIFAFIMVFRILRFVPSTLVVSSLFSFIPFFILDIMGRYNSEKVRRKLVEFISVLNRWCAIKEDVFFAFEKSTESGIGEPLNTFIKDMLVQVNYGIEPIEALDILQMKVDNSQFKDFIINIKQNIKHRGDIRKILLNLEAQFYKIEEEYNRRKISTYKDRLIVYFVMFAVLFIAYNFLSFNPKVEKYYMETIQGKTLLSLFSLLYACGFYMTFTISSFKH